MTFHIDEKEIEISDKLIKKAEAYFYSITEKEVRSLLSGEDKKKSDEELSRVIEQEIRIILSQRNILLLAPSCLLARG